VDLAVLGIGVECHIGFNERGSKRSSLTRRISLALSTINANIEAREKGYTHAFTSGVATILGSRKIILLASGLNKAWAITKTIESKPSARYPSTWLKTHPNKDVTIITDLEANEIPVAVVAVGRQEQTSPWAGAESTDQYGGDGDYLRRKVSSSNTTNLLSRSLGVTFAKRFSNTLRIILITGGCILILIIPQYISGGNSTIFAKCLSCVTIILLSLIAIFATSPLVIPLRTIRQSYRSNSSSLSLPGRFSSSRSFISGCLGEAEILFIFNQFRGVMQGCLEMLFGKLGVIIFKNFFRAGSRLEQLKDKVNHYARACEAWLAVADVGVGSYIVRKFFHFSSFIILLKNLNIFSKQSQGDRFPRIDSH